MDKTKCPECGSSEGYYRRKTSEWVCKRCPGVVKIKKVSEDGI